MNFPAIGGHAAVSLVNTRPIRAGERVELLGRFDDLVRWARQMGLIDGAQAERLGACASATEGWHALAQVIRMREQLEAAFLSGPAASLSAGLAAAIDEGATGRRGRLSFGVSEDGRLRRVFDAPLDRPKHLAALIAESVAGFYAGDLPERLKQCAGGKCVLWFLDTSRNRSRHWCSMERCGARAKAGAYYARRKRDAGARTRLNSHGD